jgi:hypothetical protein
MSRSDPVRRRPAWQGKVVTALVAGIVGVGIGAAGGGDADGDDAGASQKLAVVEKRAARDLEQTTADLQAGQQAAIEAAVTDAVAAEKTKRSAMIKKAVAAAVKETKADLAASNKPRTLVAPSAPTDPRFDTCGAANAAGYGNYRRGTDTEYGWYQDRDGDGVVCE